MPIIHNYKCQNCGDESFVVHHCLSLRIDDKEIPLPHPGESSEILKYGCTRLQAAKAGRLYENEAYACDSCKELFYKPSLELPKGMPPSRKSNIILGILIFPLMVYLKFNGVDVCTISGVFLPIGIVFVLVVSRIEEKRLHRRLIAEHSPPEVKNCPYCNSEQIAPLSDLHLRIGDNLPLKCPACGGHDLLITQLGLS